MLLAGERLAIKGDWSDEVVPDGRMPLLLHPPGSVFGTGYHPSTMGLLVALETAVTPGCLVADVGCGSGILAVAAALLGAGRVWAFDLAPKAKRSALKNVSVNGLDSTVLVLDNFPQELPPHPVDLITCNIDGLRWWNENMQAIYKALNPGGRCLTVISQPDLPVFQAEAVTQSLQSKILGPAGRWVVVELAP